MWLTILLSCIIAICAVLAVVYIVRRKIKNKGKCSDCSGHCYGCTACAYKKEQPPHNKSESTDCSAASQAAIHGERDQNEH